MAAYFADERDPQTQTTWLVANLCAARLEHGHYPKQLGLPPVANNGRSHTLPYIHTCKYLFIFKYAHIVYVRPRSLNSQFSPCTTTSLECCMPRRCSFVALFVLWHVACGMQHLSYPIVQQMQHALSVVWLVAILN